MGNSKINGGSKSGVLTTFELLKEHAEKSNREPRLCLGKIANCRQILKPFWMSMAVLWRWEHPGVVGGRATAVLAAAPLPNEGEPSRWGLCTPIAWGIPAGGGLSTDNVWGVKEWVRVNICMGLCMLFGRNQDSNAETRLLLVLCRSWCWHRHQEYWEFYQFFRKSSKVTLNILKSGGLLLKFLIDEDNAGMSSLIRFLSASGWGLTFHRGHYSIQHNEALKQVRASGFIIWIMAKT